MELVLNFIRNLLEQKKNNIQARIWTKKVDFTAYACGIW
jgi:hypothetical protein